MLWREKGHKLYRKLDQPEPESIGERWPHQHSGGELQWMMVTMVKSCEPDLIIFDEPTSTHDVTTQIEVLKTIREVIKFRQVTAIYLTHDLAIVAQLADRLIVLSYVKLN